MNLDELQQTIKSIAVGGKGILAADESESTAGKRLDSINVENTEENRRQYRNMILTAPGFEQYIAGVILHEETLHHKTDSGILFPEYLKSIGVIPGIKVDKGLKPFEGSDVEQFTHHGLEGLGDRLEEYKKFGCKFAKWRTVYSISENTPGDKLIEQNASDLAEYAKICQDHGIVPIVEPEILIDGTHSIDKCEEVTEKAQKAVFVALEKKGVELKYIILKPSMVISGKQAENRADRKEVAKRTVACLKECVPAEVPTINFLSGGQAPIESTEHLNEMHKLGEELPWNLSFSYARALQEPALKVWMGKAENLQAAQEIFIKRAKLNALASVGQYDSSMEG